MNTPILSPSFNLLQRVNMLLRWVREWLYLRFDSFQLLFQPQNKLSFGRKPSLIALGVLVVLTAVICVGLFATSAQPAWAGDPVIAPPPKIQDPVPAIGIVEPPPGTDVWTASFAKTSTGNPLIFFASRLVQIFMAVAGVWIFVNILLAGFYYVSAGSETKNLEKARGMITNSAIGLVLIMLAYSITAIVSMIFFGDPNFLINPTI